MIEKNGIDVRSGKKSHIGDEDLVGIPKFYNKEHDFYSHNLFDFHKFGLNIKAASLVKAIANFKDDNLDTIKTNIKTFIRQTRSEFASLEKVLRDFDEDDVEKLKLLQGVNFNTNAQGALMSFNNQANQGADVVQPVVVSSNTVVNQGDTTAVSGSTAVAVTPSVNNGDSSSNSFAETEF